jgi:uncharacterized protein YbaR (Trm112 family)
MALAPDLLNILVCPVCKGILIYDAEKDTLTCNGCRLIYKVVDDIPNMLVAEAEKF